MQSQLYLFKSSLINKNTQRFKSFDEKHDFDTSVDELQIWSLFEKGQLIEIDSFGHKIYEGQCKVCHKFFGNHRSFYNHGKKCLEKKRTRKTNHNISEYLHNKDSLLIQGDIEDNSNEIISSSCLNNNQRALVNAVCRLNMPISTLGKSEWHDLIKALDAKNDTPCPAKLRGLIVAYAAEIRERIDRELSGKHVTIIADGGTLGERTIYNVVFFSERKLYFGGLLHVNLSDHKTLANALQKPIKRVESKGAVIIAVITDNAKNLTLATMSSAQDSQFTKNQITCIQSITRLPIFHVPCGIHTINLAISDFEKISNKFKNFKDNITQYFKKLRLKQVKQTLRQAGITRKLPLIEEIKWRTYIEAFDFIELELDKIKDCASKNNDLFKDIIFDDSWIDYLKLLKPLGVFETIVQDSTIYLSEYYQYYIKMMIELEKIQTEEAMRFRLIIINRMKSSGLECLSHLSFILSRIDINAVKYEFQSLFSWNVNDLMNPKRFELQAKYNELTRKLVELAQFWNIKNAADVIPPIFDSFLKNIDNDKMPTEAFYRALSTKAVNINGIQVSCQGFAVVAFRISHLPASEAICERVFSHLSNLFTASRWATGDDLMNDQMTVRMQGIFDQSNQAHSSWPKIH